MTAYEAGGKGKREKEEEKAPPAGNGNGRGITDMNRITAKTPRTGAPLLTAGEMLHAVQNGELDTMLEMLGGERDMAGRRARCADLLKSFAETFGTERRAALLTVAGRSELSGNHTDHNHGCVIACSVSLGYALRRRTAHGRHRLRA